MNTFLLRLLSLSLIIAAGCSSPSGKPVELQKPNIIIIFLDDAAYADFSPFGESPVPTPGVAALASEGVAFTNFHVPQAICSASRAALLSGRNPGRTGVFGAHGPFGRGLEPEFSIMPEIFGAAGYATGIFGKWHIGDQEDTRPHARGFDESAGLMYSHDMWKYHPAEYWGQHPLQYWENGSVTIEDMDSSHQQQLTRWYTEDAVDFIRRHKEEPFFLYVPHSMPHVPLFTSEDFTNRTGQGVFADVIAELDWSVAEINNAVKDAGIEDRTIIVFTSDNGPWISYGNHAGYTPFREAKGTSFDGGVRSACIIKYPEKLEGGGISDRNFFSIDLLPTLAHLADIALDPADSLDGRNVWSWISGSRGAVNPQRFYELTNNRNFEGIVTGNGKWKLHVPHRYRTLESAGADGWPGKYVQDSIELSLFDMVNDPMETANVIGLYPEIADSLIRMAAEHQELYFPDQPLSYGPED